MKKQTMVPMEHVERRILLVRGHKVMLDSDLAELYGVKPIRLREQVKRNRERFPGDFMLQLTESEASLLVSQNAIPSRKHLGGYLPYVFTQEGIAMLSSVLRSKRAVMANIAIMRAFVRLRVLLVSDRDLAHKLDVHERECNAQLKAVSDVIRELTAPLRAPRRRIGFRA